MRRRQLPAEPLMQRAGLLLARARISAVRGARALLSPGLVAVALFVAAAWLCCAGVRLLAGDGWALIAAAVNAYVLAFGLAKAVNRG